MHSYWDNPQYHFKQKILTEKLNQQKKIKKKTNDSSNENDVFFLTSTYDKKKEVHFRSVHIMIHLYNNKQ